MAEVEGNPMLNYLVEEMKTVKGKLMA